MIPTETLKCTVPNANAVKDAVIYCAAHPTNATEIWTTVAACLTTLLTLGLLLGAVAAWRSPIKQLKLAKKAEESAFQRMEAQIAAASQQTQAAISNAQRLARKEQRLQAVSNYLTAFYSLWLAAGSTQTNAEKALQDLTAAGILWRLNYGIKNDGDGFYLVETVFGSLALLLTQSKESPTVEELKTHTMRRSAMGDAYRSLSLLLPQFYRGDFKEQKLNNHFIDLVCELTNKVPELDDVLWQRHSSNQ